MLVLVLGVIDVVSDAADGVVVSFSTPAEESGGLVRSGAQVKWRTAKGRGGALKSTKANVRMRDIQFPSITHAQAANNAGVDR